MSFTPLKRVKDAIRFKLQQASNTYIVLGGITPWADESTPPAVPLDQTTISDAFGAVKAEVRWVKEDVAGTYTVRVPGLTPGSFIDKKFSELLTKADVLGHTGSIFILLKGTVVDADLTGVSFYRKIGFSTDLVPTVGHESDLYLPSGFVSNFGEIEALEYRRPYPVEPGSSRNLYQIIQY